jgi:glycosyltransferase involved in cell wall biosynthesis
MSKPATRNSEPVTHNLQPATCNTLSYVLITPARNEEAFIEETIKSVIEQTVLPTKWVIVSDGSTDGTDDIVKKYAAMHPWIDLIRMPERGERHFAGKVHAFNAGYDRVKNLHYDIIGNLDADISFERDYISFLLSKFAENPRLGVGGTPFVEDGIHYDYGFTDIKHVSGACQLFRRECFEEIGGYKPQKVGGVDLVAVLSARMKGWQTRTFPEKTCLHHRKMGKGMHNGWTVFFKGGQGDYVLGGHPVWEIFHSIYQMKNKPFIMGGCLRLAGFYWALLRRVEKSASRDVMEFRRQEQMDRLRKFFGKLSPLTKN